MSEQPVAPPKCLITSVALEQRPAVGSRRSERFGRLITQNDATYIASSVHNSIRGHAEIVLQALRVVARNGTPKTVVAASKHRPNRVQSDDGLAIDVL